MFKSVAALCLSSAAVVLGFATSPARAQDQPQQGGIEEVVVTAERREEKLSKVPESISAFTKEDMEQLNIKDIKDLIGFTPGVTFNPESKNISIRGVDSTAGDATTGIYIDDTPIQLRALGFGSDNTLPAVFDLDRVEILRGPQGTLFGAGSEGGTVRYITPDASLTDFSLFAKTEVSTTDNGSPSYEGGVAVGGPIADDKLGFRISGWGRHDGGWIDKVDYMTGDKIQSDSNYVDTYVARASLLWQVTDELSISPSVFYQNRDQNNLDQYWVGLSNPDRGIYKSATPENMADKDWFYLPALKLDWNNGEVELISNTSYFERHERVQDYSATLYDLSYFQQSVDFGLDPDFVTTCTGGICAPIANKIAKNPDFVGAPLLGPESIDLPGFGHYKAVNNITNNQKNFTQEVRLQSSDPNSPLTWVVGLFYSEQTQLSVEEINDPQLPALTQYLWGDSMLDIWGEDLLPNGDDYINHTNAHERQVAGFFNGSYAVNDKVKIQAGLRYASTHFDFTNFSDGPQNFGFLSVPGGHKDEIPFTPMANISYQITPDDLIYGTISKGYRIGGANPLFPVAACTEIKVEPTSYNSDTVMNYEAGTKDRFFDGSLQLSGSVYYLKWNNIQQSVTLPSCAFRYTVNQGAAESRGFDMQGEWLVTDGLDIGFSLGFTDAHYTATIESATLTLANVGDKLPGSPWTFSVNAQYHTKIAEQDAYFSVQDEFQSREEGLIPERDPNTSISDSGLVPQPQTNVVTLRAGVVLDAFDVSLFADNLFNSHPQLDLTHQDSSTLLFEASTLRPRTIGITATYRQ